MARRTNIISLDEARAESRRGSAVSGKRRGRKPSDEEISRAFATASSVRERRAAYGSRTSRAASVDGPASRGSASADRSTRRRSSEAPISWNLVSSHGAATRRDGYPGAARPASRVRPGASQRGESANAAGVDALGAVRPERGEKTKKAGGRARSSETEAAVSSRERRRQARTKARAERMFQRQFASEPAQAEPAEGVPRAAVYEGKMGAKHRKSARMQRSSQAGSVSAKVNPAGWLAYLPFTARAMKIATAVVCALLVCVFLYTPAQQYYQATRDRDRLAAEYGIIEERNHALDAQNDILASDAGLEDAVRQRFGYIKTGEQTAVVTGLSESATDSSRDSEDLEPAVLSSSVKAPAEWYTPLLDTFFGVE